MAAKVIVARGAPGGATSREHRRRPAALVFLVSLSILLASCGGSNATAVSSLSSRASSTAAAVSQGASTVPPPIRATVTVAPSQASTTAVSLASRAKETTTSQATPAVATDNHATADQSMEVATTVSTRRSESTSASGNTAVPTPPPTAGKAVTAPNVTCGQGTNPDPKVADSTAVHGMFVIVDTDLGAADAVRQYLLPNPDVCGANFTVDWATVDHGPGAAPRYDWSAIAAQIAPWEQAGKVVNLVFVGAAEGAGPQTATPSYVMKQVTTIDCGPSGRPTPVFWQPGYEKNWEAFIAAAVSHFTPDRHVGYLRFGLGLGAEDFVTGEASKACTDQWDKAGLQTEWAPYNQRLIAFEGSLHSSVQLMIAINPNQGKATLAMVNTKQAVAEGIGFGNQGLAADDVTAINNRTPCPNADWCNLFSMYSGKVPLEEQTLAASDPAPNVSAAADLKIGPNSPRTGPLPALLQVALREHTQIFELYVQDLLMAFDPAWPGYSEYHRAYAEALGSTASIVGTFEGADPGAETSAASVPGSGTATAIMTPHGGPLGALYDAIQVYQDQQGIPATNYQAAATVATADQTWAYFTIRPTAAAKNSLQGGYGYARLTNGGWSVVAFGTEGVGCASRPPVPTRVRQEFAAGQPCP